MTFLWCLGLFFLLFCGWFRGFCCLFVFRVFFDFAGLFVYANLFFRIAVAAVTGGAIGVIDT